MGDRFKSKKSPPSQGAKSWRQERAQSAMREFIAASKGYSAQERRAKLGLSMGASDEDCDIEETARIVIAMGVEAKRNDDLQFAEAKRNQEEREEEQRRRAARDS